jgi:hypothetical protein
MEDSPRGLLVRGCCDDRLNPPPIPGQFSVAVDILARDALIRLVGAILAERHEWTGGCSYLGLDMPPRSRMSIIDDDRGSARPGLHWQRRGHGRCPRLIRSTAWSKESPAQHCLRASGRVWKDWSGTGTQCEHRGGGNLVGADLRGR